MTTRPDRGRCGQVLIVAVLLIGIVFSAIVGTGLLAFHRGEIAPVQGQPMKDTNTGLYTVYFVVKGRRISPSCTEISIPTFTSTL